MKKLASPSNFFFFFYFFLVDCYLTAFSRSPSAFNCLYCSIPFDFIVVYSSSIMLLCKVSMAPHGQVLSIWFLKSLQFCWMVLATIGYRLLRQLQRATRALAQLVTFCICLGLKNRVVIKTASSRREDVALFGVCRPTLISRYGWLNNMVPMYVRFW